MTVFAVLEGVMLCCCQALAQLFSHCSSELCDDEPEVHAQGQAAGCVQLV